MKWRRKSFCIAPAVNSAHFCNPTPAPQKQNRAYQHNVLKSDFKQTSGRSGAANWHQAAKVWDFKLSGREITQSTEDVSK